MIKAPPLTLFYVPGGGDRLQVYHKGIKEIKAAKIP
jgi:hypothetical protein